MWPFNKFKPKSESDDDQLIKNMRRSVKQANFSGIKEFRSIGETFNYLGKTMLVTDHERWTASGVFPTLVCDYIDDCGKVQTIDFAPRELPILRKQQGISNT